MGKTVVPYKQIIKTRTEDVYANSFGTITPSVDTDRIIQIRATNSSINLIILPIYNTEYKVYSINSNGNLVAYTGSVNVKYYYI